MTNQGRSRIFRGLMNPLRMYRSREKIGSLLLMRMRYAHLGVHIPLSTDIWGTFLIFKHPDARIKIGEGVTFRNRLKYNPAGVIHPTVLRAAVPGANLSIGNRVGISGATICCEISITIGDFCLLGANCSIYDTDYHPLDYLDRRVDNQDATKRAPVVIDDDCWIGANAVILKGVTIGARSVIGANSVVTSNIPPDSIAVGNPAQVVRHLPTPLN